MDLMERNRKIIEAVIKKAERACPGALALVGINGSFMMGDFYEKSDLDLLVLVNDDGGARLGHTFIQDDLQVGHDIYTVTWDFLEDDARYEHPNISKLMDAKIVYCADEKYRERLEALRKKAAEILAAPFSEEDYAKAEKLLREAEHYYTLAMLSEGRSEVLSHVGRVIYYIENAIAMLNKQYFHYGVKRAYEELSAMRHRPERLCERIDAVITAASVSEAQQRVSVLMKETMAVFNRVKESMAAPKEAPGAENLTGTYEEMYSNWRNKMHAAAQDGNRHLAFMSLISAGAMLEEINLGVDIGAYDALGGYNAQDLSETATAFDALIDAFRAEEYRKANLPVMHYADIDDFARHYGEQ